MLELRGPIARPYAYDFTLDVERTSIDEGYFDLTANRKKPALKIALIISKAIRQSLKITVSEGVAFRLLHGWPQNWSPESDAHPPIQP